MKAQDGKLWKDFVVYIHEHAGEILKPVAPLGVWMNLETIGALRNRLHRLMELDRELEAFSRVQKSLSDEVDAELEKIPAANDVQEQRQLSPSQLETKSERLLEKYERYNSSSETEQMRSQRAHLPLNQYADDVMKLFESSDVCVLVGATGSGKTTQVPQLLLNEAIQAGRGAECNVICTQPRRIAAMSVAKRVASERNEQLREHVGYQVRFGNATHEWGGSITYCTTGVLLRQLREGYGALKGVTHVIVDEVHERDVQIDFLMVLLKRILEARRRGEDVPPIKVILMSATIDTTLFRRYFGAAFDNGECPHIEIPGRMFPVEKFYLDDIQTMLNQYPGVKESLDRDPFTKKYIANEIEARKDINNVMKIEEEEAEVTGIDWAKTGSEWEREDADLTGDVTDQPDLLIANTIAHLCSKKDDGAVLVFLPGIREIVSLDKLLKSQKFLGQDFTDESQYRVFMLHSSIPTMQQDVFLPLKQGRKIILATNIAETSVTIPEVAYVVDTCKHRENRFSQLRRSTALVCTWISQSSARQRMGRAGRVKAGEYYALVYPERHAALPTAENAEIKRTDLQTVCLDVRSYGIKEPIADVLEECIEPPSSLAVITALKCLTNLGALDNDEDLTPLGSILSQL
jgi:ATP-dependent RNA helicase DHX36